MSEQQALFPERSDPDGFQLDDNESFSTTLHTSRRLKRKKTPQYRLINRYSKSTRQYWKERARRKKAYELHSDGFTRQQIAEQLGVNARTVSRDLKRTRRYHAGQFDRMIRQVEAERDAEYTKRYGDLSLAEQRRQLKADFQFLTKMLATRKRLQRTLTFTIDVDEFLACVEGRREYGRPFIAFSPRRVNCGLSDLHLKFQFRLDGKIYPHATLTFGG